MKKRNKATDSLKATMTTLVIGSVLATSAPHASAEQLSNENTKGKQMTIAEKENRNIHPKQA
ncbi:hypothetical protein, partial [Bacillus wiedmannii]|uniref:hypothetical protein n=1 Tax=Bacillus wiedmannii TaxID=1890302 RepID=UPI000BEE5962